MESKGTITTKGIRQGRSTQIIPEVASLLLAVVFAYTAVSKVYDWYGTKMALTNQIFPNWISEILLYGLPLVEVAVAVMLLLPGTRRTALVLGILLMTAFTAYVATVMTGVFGRIPCSCGGVISSLSWGEHLVFNLAVLGIAIWGLWATKQKKKENNPIR